MKKNKKDFGLLTLEQRKVAVDKIIGYFASERDEKIGIIAAENLLDMFLDLVGQSLFNKGVKETRELIRIRFQEIDFDIELLLKDN